MTSTYVQERCFHFAVEIVNFCFFLEQEFSLKNVIAKQLLRSGTSVGANAEEAQAGQSRADFIAKLSISQKEAREALYWLKLIQAANFTVDYPLEGLIKEADEIVRILTASTKKAKMTKTY